MSQAMANPVSLQRVIEESWRFEPHLYAAHVSGGAWKMYRWLKFLGEAICDAVMQDRGRLIVNAPPGTGKSELISHWLPLWYLHLWPERRVILASHGAELAKVWGRKVRNESITNPLVGFSLSQDSKSVARWHTTQGGGMMAVGIEGSVTGFRADLIIIDDPVKDWQDSQSYLKRELCKEWFTKTLYDRAEPGATIILVMQRWHEDDLSGYLIDHHSDDWTLLRLPAFAEEDDCLGRAPGEILCPERFSEAALEADRKSAGDRGWLAKYQQRPKSTGAGRVYCNFDPAINIDSSVDFRDGLPLHLSLDFNSNPGMHGIIGQWDKELDFFTAVDEIYLPGTSVRDFMPVFVAWIKAHDQLRYPRLHLFGDATGRARDVNNRVSSWFIVKQALDAACISYTDQVPRANPERHGSIDAFNDALRDMGGVCHYKVHPRCKRLIIDFKDLRADEFGLMDKRDKLLSHASDAERYRVEYLRSLSPKFPELTGGRFILA